MKNLFLIIGAPGSGKTTDASIIAQQDEKFAHFSTGDLLRAEVASGSELGKLIDGFISKGNLVPLDVVVNAIVSAIKSSNKSNIIFINSPPVTSDLQLLFYLIRMAAGNDPRFAIARAWLQVTPSVHPCSFAAIHIQQGGFSVSILPHIRAVS